TGRGAPQREPRGFDAHSGGVLVVRGDRARSLAASAPERLRDLGSLQAPVRYVTARTDDPSHGSGVYDAGVSSGRSDRIGPNNRTGSLREFSAPGRRCAWPVSTAEGLASCIRTRYIDRARRSPVHPTI